MFLQQICKDFSDGTCQKNTATPKRDRFLAEWRSDAPSWYIVREIQHGLTPK